MPTPINGETGTGLCPVASDIDLIGDVARGDRSAFRAFYDRHAPRVLGVLVGILRDRQDADDVLQDTFWHVWTRANQFEPARGNPMTWLTQIARSRATDFFRRNRHTSPTTDHTTATTTPCVMCEASLEAERNESRRRIEQALARLPAEQREALRLAFFAGMTHQQISQQQATPLGTVKTRIRLGMRQLADMLAPPLTEARS